MLSPQFSLDLHREITVDLFAGGGGASTGIEQAIENCIDLHDQLLSLVTPQQMTKAYDEMRRRIAAGETLDVRTMQ